MEVVSTLSEDVIINFFHDCVDLWRGIKVGLIKKYGQNVGLEHIMPLKRLCLDIIRYLVNGQFGEDEIESALQTKFKLEGQLANTLAVSYLIREQDIKEGAKSQLQNISLGNLHDFDWVTKLSLSDSKLFNHKVPLTVVQLNVLQKGEKKDLTMEFQKEELDNLIENLENASIAAANAN
eukprot:CAMPEP_0115014300 /NCGR_PEP_ID=MMETSP0216-20121206/25983_1 /TAXON_ID=223996 /ORGANISM="Protocruzia adherens, Strain Boccale" /LENGTH=178 /DNA_ID=CAMNT_0002383987 /DNA_START=35 /DNA_END=571 /DNA_ORIENTATION=-